MFNHKNLCLLIFLSLFKLVHVLPQKNVTCVNGKIVYSSKHNSHGFEECCPGYTQENTLELTNGIKCVPFCMPACKNSECVGPQTCKCNVGFTADPKLNHSCLPYCSDGCDHGTCTAPEVCQCHHGYIYDLFEEACRPVCTEPCFNGTCVSPENCQCNAGYRKSALNTCEAYCSVGCDNGFCVAPETCSCIPGYSNLNDQGICKPICSSCLNGVCAAPDTCVCNPGFDKYKNTCVRFHVTETTTDDITTDEVSTTDNSATEDPTTKFSKDIKENIEKDGFEYETTTHNAVLGSDAALKGKDGYQKPLIWTVPVVGSLLLVGSVLSLGILFMNWAKIIDFLFGQSYIVE